MRYIDVIGHLCMGHRCNRTPVVKDSLRRTYCSECAIKVLKQKPAHQKNMFKKIKR
jgi:hypothetical protein